MVTKCPKCQADISEDSHFCSKCGMPIKPGEAASVTLTKTIQKPMISLDKIIAGKYKILEEIGQGGMGVVYKAEDTKLDRVVALKFLPPDLTLDPESRQRFVQEAKAAAALNHPHICTIYEIDEADGQTFIAMEYIEGPTLKERLIKGPLNIDEVAEIGIQVARGLKQAHNKDIIHRDIKPANIIINNEGQAKIMDFGLAKLSGGIDLTKVSTIVGTIAYMSPEQAQGEKVDFRSDIWSLGVTLYEMLTGHLPFIGENEASMLSSLLHKEPDPLKTHLEQIPEGWQRIINKALSKDVQHRYQDMQELCDDLLRFKEGLRIYQKAVAPSKSKVIRIASLVVFAIIFVVAGYQFLMRFLPQEEIAPEPGLPSRKVIAVLPFSYTGGDEHSDMSVGMVDLLSVNLDGAGDIVSIDPRSLLGVVGQQSAEMIDVQFGERISQQFNAHGFVLGAIIEAGGQFRINAALYESEDTSQVQSQANVQGDANDLFALVDGLTTQLLAGVETTPRRRLAQVAAATTDSLSALKAYLEGEKELRAGHIKLAREAFRRAVEEDETFALAWLRLSVALHIWGGGVEEALEALIQAKKHSDRLSDHDLLRIDAWDAVYEGNVKKIIPAFKAIIKDYPEDLEARNNLAGALGAYGPMVGADFIQDSWDNLIFVLKYKPDDFQTYQGLVQQAIKLRRFQELEAFTQKFLELAPEHPFRWSILVAIPFVTRDQAGIEKICAEIAEGETLALAGIGVVATDSGLPSDALPMIQAYASVEKDESFLSMAHVFTSYIKLAEGKQKVALDALQVAGSYRSESTHIFGPIFATLPDINISQDELKKIRENLNRWEPNPPSPQSTGNNFFDMHGEIQNHIRHYFIGLISVHLDEYDLARRYADELIAMEIPPYPKSMILCYANSILAHIHRKEGQLEEALDLLDQETPRINFPDMAFSPFYSLAALRYLRAEILYELGQYEEALRWYEAFHYSYPYDIIYRAGAYFRCGDINEKLGKTDEAVESYSNFVKLWSECDPDLRPLVKQAEERIEQLGGQK